MKRVALTIDHQITRSMYAEKDANYILKQDKLHRWQTPNNLTQKKVMLICNLQLLSLRRLWSNITTLIIKAQSFKNICVFLASIVMEPSMVSPNVNYLKKCKSNQSAVLHCPETAEP